ncbi:MAG TPA: RDD family protein, partial [Nitrospirae bacterium]|nr:RDD family protein [Nitrospirota bacterium]
LAYTTFFLGKFAATPGKMACGLKVLRADGESVSYWRAAGRHLAEFVSSLTLMIGYLMAAFDSEKRALHDRMCNTRVIKK